jgi:rubrerythrin
VSSGLRSRELRLRRAFRRIVALTIASPLAAFAACHSSDEAEGLRADASSRDAAAPEGGAGGDSPDPCAPVEIDGAYIEGDAGSDGCATFRLAPCGLPPDAETAHCLPSLDVCLDTCGADLLFYCQLAPVTCTLEAGILADANVIVECISCAGASGRRPFGLCAPRLPNRMSTGDYFAAMAHLESASVRAFRDLERWLAALGAPRCLVRAARRAAADERRHARAIARLARRFGGSPVRPRVLRARQPSLVELLEDDAVEGCAGETFGALLATWQAERAGDPTIARAMRGIAIDETRHAALAWEVMRWGYALLGDDERVRVRRKLAGALCALERRRPPRLLGTTRRTSGHPDTDVERRLASELARAVRDEASRSLDHLEHVSNGARPGARMSP